MPPIETAISHLDVSRNEVTILTTMHINRHTSDFAIDLFRVSFMILIRLTSHIKFKKRGFCSGLFEGYKLRTKSFKLHLTFSINCRKGKPFFQLSLILVKD